MARPTDTDAEQEIDDSDQPVCTDKLCNGDAEFAYWMPDMNGFSRVHDAHESHSYDDGDLHPYVCQECRDRMADSPHWDADRFRRPEETLVGQGADR